MTGDADVQTDTKQNQIFSGSKQPIVVAQLLDTHSMNLIRNSSLGLESLITIRYKIHNCIYLYMV